MIVDGVRLAKNPPPILVLVVTNAASITANPKLKKLPHEVLHDTEANQFLLPTA